MNVTLIMADVNTVAAIHQAVTDVVVKKALSYYQIKDLAQVCHVTNSLCNYFTCFCIIYLYKFMFFTDVDECTRGTPCGEGNKCANNVGGHVCTCRVGYRASPDATACVDIDECKEDPNACQNGNCINTAGSFLCQCLPGYKLETNAMVCIGTNLLLYYFIVTFSSIHVAQINSNNDLVHTELWPSS